MSTRPPHTPGVDHLDSFLEVFFGAGNTVWPDRDPQSSTGQRLAPYLQVLRDRTEVPVILPRRKPDADQLIAYVIPHDEAHAAFVAEALTAFVGYTYSTFDGSPARLDPTDPIDNAVRDFANHDRIYTIAGPTREHEGKTWAALTLLQTTMRLRRGRSWHAPPRPVGRLIAEFNVALAAGDNAASAAVLEQLTATGALSAANIAYLKIKRLARLGRDSELLRLPELSDVLATRPPVPVKDAVLAALYATVVAEPLDAGDIAGARTALFEVGTPVLALLDSPLAELSTEAVVVLALAALICDDTALLNRLRSSTSDVARLTRLAPALGTDFPLSVEPTSDAAPSVSTPVQPAPASWLELATAVASNRDHAGDVLAEEAWREWDPPAAIDDQLADVLANLDDAASERIWALVGPFIDADGYQTPAARSAKAFLDNAFVHDRFRPADLAGLVALTDIILRAGPSANDYASLLADIAAIHDRWVAPDRAPIVLDLVDLLVRMPCPDPEARLRLAIDLLARLRDHHHRLDADQLAFAEQLSGELNTQLSWPAPPTDPASASAPETFRSGSVLLYSLDEQVLARTSDTLSAFAPELKISTSHDKVGNPRLKQLARSADIIVMATRCATHAATGFIRSSAQSAMVTEAEGSGSASLTRAAIAALTARAQDR